VSTCLQLLTVREISRSQRFLKIEVKVVGLQMAFLLKRVCTPFPSFCA
jgi:hypothetical protein